MLKQIMDKKKVNKSELSKELKYGCRRTLYQRLQNPSNITIGEAETIARILEIPLRDVIEIVIGNKEVQTKYLK